MSEVNLHFLVRRKITHLFSFKNLLLYMTRDYFMEDHWTNSQGLMGTHNAHILIYQKSDVLSLAYLLKNQYQSRGDISPQLDHLVLSWQSKETSYYTIKKEIDRLFSHYHSIHPLSMWFIHTQTAHPHAHLLLLSSNQDLLVKRQIKKDMAHYNQVTSNIRNFNNHTIKLEQLNIKPLSFYQWMKVYLKDQLLSLTHRSDSNWSSLIKVLNFCGVRIIGRHQSFVWETQVNGRSIYIKPSLIDKNLSSNCLIKQWGPFTDTLRLPTHSKISYQAYCQLYTPEKTINSHPHHHQWNRQDAELRQLRQQYYASLNHGISLRKKHTYSYNKTQQGVVIERLFDRSVVSRRGRQYLINALNHSPTTLKAIQQTTINKKPSWIQFLINEAYLNNTFAQHTLTHIWQYQLKQSQHLTDFIRSRTLGVERALTVFNSDAFQYQPIKQIDDKRGINR
ncbi:MAG: hypothetical protein KGN31_04660 [Betaproteobacteria bacterium]|nr:hypothetical protein [Betaproteobacteria bacterium]